MSVYVFIAVMTEYFRNLIRLKIIQSLLQFLLNPAHMTEMRNAHSLVFNPAGNLPLRKP
jgi:hypothetical protein